jgi:hypothetical protein
MLESLERAVLQGIQKGLIDPTALATWSLTLVTLLFAVITAYLAIVTARGVKQSLRTDALARFTTAWDSVDVRARRRRFAEWVLQNRGSIPDAATSGVGDVLDFFETVGSLLRSGRLDKRLVWYAFAGAAVGWWIAVGGNYVREARKLSADNYFYSEYEYLVVKMQRRTKRHHGKKYIWGEDDVERFLLTEKNLFVPSGFIAHSSL